jgi:methyl-accepting chemotaxis protein
MSADTKQAAKEIQETIKKVHQVSEELVKKAGNVGDKSLTEKLRRVSESTHEVSEHLRKHIGS